VDEGPDPECHWGGSQVSLLLGSVHVLWSGYRVDIGSEREEEDNYVGELAVSVILR